MSDEINLKKWWDEGINPITGYKVYTKDDRRKMRSNYEPTKLTREIQRPWERY